LAAQASEPAALTSARNSSFKGQPAMPLMSLVLTLIVVGVLLWLVNSYIPMDAKIKNILNVVVVIVVVVWLLQVFGVIGPVNAIRIR
jgi:hypothetical protein